MVRRMDQMRNLSGRLMIATMSMGTIGDRRVSKKLATYSRSMITPAMVDAELITATLSFLDLCSEYRAVC